MRLTSGLPMVSPVLSRGKIQVSTWNEKAAHHTYKEGKYSRVLRALRRAGHVASSEANPRHSYLSCQIQELPRLC